MRKAQIMIAITSAVLLALAFFQTGVAEDAATAATRGGVMEASYKRLSSQDRAEILELIYRYSHTIDGKDLEGFVSLFTEDCRWIANLPEKPIVLESRGQLREYVAMRLQYFSDKGIQTRHLQMNIILTPLSYGRVRGTTYLTLLGQVKEESTPRLISTGIYQDEFVRTEEGWRFAIREATLDQGKLPRVDK